MCQVRLYLQYILLYYTHNVSRYTVCALCHGVSYVQCVVLYYIYIVSHVIYVCVKLYYIISTLCHIIYAGVKLYYIRVCHVIYILECVMLYNTVRVT